MVLQRSRRAIARLSDRVRQLPPCANSYREAHSDMMAGMLMPAPGPASLNHKARPSRLCMLGRRRLPVCLPSLCKWAHEAVLTCPLSYSEPQSMRGHLRPPLWAEREVLRARNLAIRLHDHQLLPSEYCRTSFSRNLNASHIERKSPPRLQVPPRTLQASWKRRS